jgi:UDP-galactopyranose mutase
MPRVLIAGAGLSGCTVAHRLATVHGIESVVCERSSVPGGLIRSEHLEGVLYEPHGSHIFHTDDDEVWSLATAMTPFRDYRHQVAIQVCGGLYSWPILRSDIERQPDAERVLAELDARREVDPAERAGATSFEDWCLRIMGPTLYERYVRDYTAKQWGRPASELRASWAPRRVQVRRDDNRDLFLDRHQGWPAGPNGYTDLIDGLLATPGVTLECDRELTLENAQAVMREHGCDALVVTAPLDAFCGDRLGVLGWRGIVVRSVHVPHVELAQDKMVVNYPGLEYPFIRVHETKHASGQECEGTVLGFEFPGAPTRYYPIETPESVALNRAYQALVADRLGRDTFFCGRLASYRYLDMDDCMREGLDTGDLVAAEIGRRGASAPHLLGVTG